MSRKIFCLAVVATLLILFTVWYSRESRPVRIGFIADFDSELGVAGRNGALLAIEEINAAGGIRGHRVELVAKNTRGDKQQAWEGTATLINEEVDAILGHMISEMSISTLDLINQSDVIMISPTASTDLLSGRDDNFLRVYPSTAAVATKLAQYTHRRGIKRFAIIYDQSNHAFGQSWLAAFGKTLTALGGGVEEVIPFNGRSAQTSYLNLVRQVSDACVDGVLIIANPISTALISQQFAKVDCKAHLYATEWSYSPDLFKFGGEKIQDLTIVQTYLPENQDAGNAAFRKKMRKRFNQDAWFGSVHAYDATRMVIAALQRGGGRAYLKKNLLDFGVFEGVQSLISMDAQGDAERISYIRRISDGKILQLAQL